MAALHHGAIVCRGDANGHRPGTRACARSGRTGAASLTIARDLLWGRIVVLAALAAAGRLVLIGIPNVSLAPLVVFVAGLGYGARTGAAVGFSYRVATDVALTGLHPTVLVLPPIEAALGALYGLIGRWVDVGQRRDQARAWALGMCAAIGWGATLAFSVAADTAEWLVFRFVLPGAPDAVQLAYWGARVVAGLAFNALPAIIHAGVLAVAAPRILSALRINGLLDSNRSGGQLDTAFDGHG